MLHFSDVFESGEHIVVLDPVFVTDLLQQVGRDDGLDKELLAVNPAQFVPAGEDITGHERGDLVAGQQDEFSLIVADGAAHAVGIRVGAQRDVGTHGVGPFHHHPHGRRLFRIGRHDRREIAVAHILVVHMVDLRETGLLEPGGHQADARAMERRIGNLDVVVAGDAFRRKQQRQLAVEEGLVHFGTDALREGRLIDFHLFHRGDLAHFGDDILVMRRDDLGAVLPEYLVAVVFLGIVRCRNHDARLALEIADGEAQFRRRPDIVEDIDMDVIGHQHAGRDLGEQLAVVPAVVGDDGRNLFPDKILLEIVGKPLRGHGHGIAVHAVGAGAHHAAQSARSELERAVECIFQHFRIAFYHFQYFPLGFNIVPVAQPGFGHFKIICHGFLSLTFKDRKKDAKMLSL